MLETSSKQPFTSFGFCVRVGNLAHESSETKGCFYGPVKVSTKQSCPSAQFNMITVMLTSTIIY